jgi:hypothetical protein
MCHFNPLVRGDRQVRQNLTCMVDNIDTSVDKAQQRELQ